MNYNDVLQRVQKVTRERPLLEALTKASIARMRSEIASPEIRPCAFDVSIAGWIERLSLWGKIKFTYIDPDTRAKQVVSRKQFIDRVNDETLTQMFGRWSVEERDINKVALVRKYQGLDGRKKVEKFLIDIELRPELR